MTKNNQQLIAPSNFEITKLSISGTLPNWLEGKLIRNGPALFKLKHAELKHWFDGYGMLHGFTFRDGEIYYQSRYTESKEYLNASNTGKVSTVGWGTASDPCRSIFRRFMANFTASPDNTNVNVVKIGSKYYTTSDISTINEFDFDSLETLSNFNAKKSAVMAAHPSYTSDGLVWNMTSSFGPVATNSFVALTDEPNAEKHGTFTTKKLYYFHSFGETDRYLISIEQPMQLDFVKLITSGPKNKSFYECFEWNAEATNKLHILDRQTGTVQHLDTDLTFFYFHTINSYEEAGKIIIDLAGYDNNAIIDDFYQEKLATNGIPDEHKASIRRLTIDLKTSKVNMEDFKINLELPNINDIYLNKKHQYAYGVSSPKGDKRLASQITKYDFIKNTSINWSEEHVSVGEPLFVARPNADSEDDGVVIVLCDNQKTASSYLAILDAKNLKTIARADIPQHIPTTLHGWFYR